MTFLTVVWVVKIKNINVQFLNNAPAKVGFDVGLTKA